MNMYPVTDFFRTSFYEKSYVNKLDTPFPPIDFFSLFVYSSIMAVNEKGKSAAANLMDDMPCSDALCL